MHYAIIVDCGNTVVFIVYRESRHNDAQASAKQYVREHPPLASYSIVNLSMRRVNVVNHLNRYVEVVPGVTAFINVSKNGITCTDNRLDERSEALDNIDCTAFIVE